MRAIALVVLLTLGVPAGGAAVQADPPPDDTTTADTAVAPAPAAPGPWGAVDVMPRWGTTVVTVTVALPTGSASDPEDGSGTAWLLGATVRELVLSSMEPEARALTELQVEVDRSWTLYRLVTLPELWEEGVRLLTWALFESRPPAGSLERARVSIDEVFLFEASAPVRDFELEFYRQIAGQASPWTRAPRGTPEALERITAAELSTHRFRHYRQDDAVVSVVGRVEPDQGLAALGADAGGAGASFQPLEDAAGGQVWEAEERRVLTREVTSAWIGVAYPVDPGLPRTSLDLLVHNLDRRFNPSPPDPGTFHVDVYVEHGDAGPLLVVEAAVVPEAAGGWEQRILQAVDEIEGQVLEPPFFRSQRRRFRTSTLLTEAAPEVEGRRRALDLLREGRVRELRQEIAALTGTDLQQAAAGLGPPRILIYGPDLQQGTSW